MLVAVLSEHYRYLPVLIAHQKEHGAIILRLAPIGPIHQPLFRQKKTVYCPSIAECG